MLNNGAYYHYFFFFCFLGYSAKPFRRTLTGGDENRRDGRPPRSRRRSEDEVVEDFLATGKLSSLDRVRNYLEDLRKNSIEGAHPLRRYYSSEMQRPDYPTLPRHRISSLDESVRKNRDRTFCYNMDRPMFTDTNKNLNVDSNRIVNSSEVRNHIHNTDETNDYNQAEKNHVVPSTSDKCVQSDFPSKDCPNAEEAKVSNNNEKSKRDTKNVEKNSKKDKNGSRVNKAINSLRKKSEMYENEFSESKLLKRAVSLEDVKTELSRNMRASSLKPEGTLDRKDSFRGKAGFFFDSLNRKKEDREVRIANLKRLDFGRGSEISTESTPTGENDEGSMISATDNSDTWSSCDMGERFLDPSAEDCVSERIRRKSFYHRFNTPKRQTYHRSTSNMERKRYY